MDEELGKEPSPSEPVGRDACSKRLRGQGSTGEHSEQKVPSTAPTGVTGTGWGANCTPSSYKSFRGHPGRVGSDASVPRDAEAHGTSCLLLVDHGGRRQHRASTSHHRASTSHHTRGRSHCRGPPHPPTQRRSCRWTRLPPALSLTRCSHTDETGTWVSPCPRLP